MKIKSKFLIPIITLFACALIIGTTYSAWVYDSSKSNNNAVQFEVPDWRFGEQDDDFARRANVYGSTNLSVSAESSLFSNSNEAIRLTNTHSGPDTVDHFVTINTDRKYYLNEISTMKVEFDYYHGHKRDQKDRGLPSVKLMKDNTEQGNAVGGGDRITSASITSTVAYFATDIGNDWWHMEYFITALCPPYCAHGDSVPNQSTVYINRIKIIDRNICNLTSGSDTTAYVVIDNLRFTSTLSPRLGLFNKGASFTLANGYYWMKIAWAGELSGGFAGVSFSFSSPGIVEQDTSQTKSPFYLHALSKGSVDVTVTLTIIDGDGFQYLSLTNTITVT